MTLLKKDTAVLIATFSPWIKGRRLSINGNVEPLLDFFVPKVRKTVLIDQPYPGSDTLIPRIEVYEKGKKARILSSSAILYILYPFMKITNYNGTHLSFKLRDFFSIIEWVFRDRTKYDFFIGLEAVNALAGILLRKLGRIRRVIYYVSDYSPNRYKIPFVNAFYVWLDSFCAMHADVIWDVSKAMQPARIKAGLVPNKSAPVLHVPNALYPTQIKIAPLGEILPETLVFMGTLGPENGPDIGIKALPYVLKKVPQARLHIIGGGKQDEDRLRKLTEALGLTDKVTFHGFISDREEISRKIRKFQIALAPYPAFPGSPRFYGDATKIRAYLAAGLPVITTHVPPLGKEAVEKGAALQVKDNEQDLAYTIIDVLRNKKMYLLLRKRAIAFAKDNTWENEFSKAFTQMQKILLH